MIDRQARNIALIGFMGVGKTSIGRVLARLLNMDFVDADAEIEKISKMPIPRIFEIHGEGHFRCLEYEYYREIQPLRNTVIATGGGAILDERTRAGLRENALVVYLAASSKTVLTRIGDDNSRPLLSDGDKSKKISALMAERDSLYRQACHVAIDTDSLDIDVCAKKITQLYLGLTKRP